VVSTAQPTEAPVVAAILGQSSTATEIARTTTTEVN
jgi:hypothetical protein